jgi:diguanylate cyclase (GGDEF)-like protein
MILESTGMSFYSVVCFYCALILGFILYKLIKDTNLTKTYKTIVILAISTQILLFIADAFGNFINVGKFAWGKNVNAIIHFIYFTGLGTTCYFGYLLLECIDDSVLYKNKKLRYSSLSLVILLTLIAFISMILIFAGSHFHFLYYMTEEGKYARGDFNFMQIVCSFAYLLIELIHGLYGLFVKKNYAKFGIYKYMILYVFVVAIGVTLQMFLPKYPFTEMALTVDSILIYNLLLQEQVLTDGLTRVYNRNALFKHLETVMTKSNEKLYLFMIDLDGFKAINDIYGHTEGDEALKCFAAALRDLSVKTGAFGFRYGGDEFTVVAEIEEDQFNDFIKMFDDITTWANDKAQKQFKIEMSYGFTKYDPSKHLSSIDLINCADEMLYIRKNEKKSLR